MHLPITGQRWDRAVTLLLLSASIMSTSRLKIGIGFSYRKMKLLFLHSQICGLGSIPATDLLLSWPLLLLSLPSFCKPFHLCPGAQVEVPDIAWVLAAQVTTCPSTSPGIDYPLPPSITSGRTHPFTPAFHSFILKMSCVRDHFRQQKYSREQTSSFSPEDCILKVRDRQ